MGDSGQKKSYPWRIADIFQMIEKTKESWFSFVRIFPSSDGIYQHGQLYQPV